MVQKIYLHPCRDVAGAGETGHDMAALAFPGLTVWQPACRMLDANRGRLVKDSNRIGSAEGLM